mmetsp:Transcript_7490/g.12757  ORF Transcript_7490/g.12757 Transcript_7490/m.12757 type:complete len:367 (-) Transcript_7490:178-1278(-)
MQDPDGQQDAAVMNAGRVGVVTDPVNTRFVDVPLDPVADQQPFVVGAGAQPVRYALVMLLCRKPGQISRAVGPQTAGVKVMQNAIPDQGRHMTRGGHQHVVELHAERARGVAHNRTFVPPHLVLGPIVDGLLAVEGPERHINPCDTGSGHDLAQITGGRNTAFDPVLGKGLCVPLGDTKGDQRHRGIGAVSGLQYDRPVAIGAARADRRPDKGDGAAAGFTAVGLGLYLDRRVWCRCARVKGVLDRSGGVMLGLKSMGRAATGTDQSLLGRVIGALARAIGTLQFGLEGQRHHAQSESMIAMAISSNTRRRNQDRSMAPSRSPVAPQSPMIVATNHVLISQNAMMDQPPMLRSHPAEPCFNSCLAS